MRKITTMRELQKAIADNVQEYLDNTLREHGDWSDADVSLAIEASDVGDLIAQFVEDNIKEVEA